MEPKDSFVTLKPKLLLAALAALLLAPAAGLAEDVAPAKKAETAAPRKRAKPSAPKPVAEKAPEAPDCPRGSYRGDPVCFGAEDAGGLPLPSSSSGSRGNSAPPRRTGDVTVAPKTWLNESAGPESMTYFNNPNPHPSTNGVGGGAGVDFHF